MSKSRLVKQILKYGCQQIALQTHTQPVHSLSECASVIQHLKSTAFHNKLVSLSANQINEDQSIFVCLKKQLLTLNRWSNCEVSSQRDYEAILNPKILQQSDLELWDYEQCPSMQGLKFKVPCPALIRIAYQQFKSFEQKQTNLSGFQCRVWYHQIKHCLGSLIIDYQISRGQIQLIQEFIDSQNIQYLKNLKQHSITFSKDNLQKLKDKSHQLPNIDIEDLKKAMKPGAKFLPQNKAKFRKRALPKSQKL